ncbi:hypothetical protein BGX27_008269 [Mortierella sp. AM989]|nr:hypothetical protein BGX27_008269 [Mortierella sp. AM989]
MTRTLRKLAYFPVKKQSFVLDNHIIAGRPKLKQLFGNGSEDMILQFAFNRCSGFTGDLFVASFDMLWLDSGNDYSGLPPAASVKLPKPSWTYWIKSFLHLILYKIKLNPGASVVCHNFSRGLLGNPAIEALVEYKWNTFGYKYWISRFLFQCFYYLLILAAVFGQVYGERHDFSSVFVAIAIISIIFLWLEVNQFLRHRKRHFKLFYDIIDVIAYSLPLVGSIDQLLINGLEPLSRGHPGILSFSVVFAALQFLLEIRINTSVCYIVIIIIQVLSEIRVFLFITLGGILAFSTAILHYLRSCPQRVCSEVPTEFPHNYYSAVTATIYFMGGRYDPVSDYFKTDDWMFLTLMIFNFFFSGLLMLNILIALIGGAFTRGDKTWRMEWLKNRMLVVEAAENLTYHIPGFRKYYNWFPREIYYTALNRDVKIAYEKETEILEAEAVENLALWFNGTKYVREDEQPNGDIGELSQIRSQLNEQKATLEAKTDKLEQKLADLQAFIAEQMQAQRASQDEQNKLQAQLLAILKKEQ